MSEIETRIREEIQRLAHKRGIDKTFCPSTVRSNIDMNINHPMERIRKVASTMAENGQITVTQNGTPVSIDEVSGPIRLGLPGDFPENDPETEETTNGD